MNNDWCRMSSEAEQAEYPAADESIVNVADRYEVRRWCQRLVCTEAQLRAAVVEVGKNPSKVRQLLRDRR